jgi:hypothetical protein
MFNSNHAFLAFLLVQKLISAWGTKLVKAEVGKIFSICPKLLINAELYGLVLAPRLKKRVPSNLGSQFATLVAIVVEIISNLGPDKKPKMLKVGPKFFQS